MLMCRGSPANAKALLPGQAPAVPPLNPKRATRKRAIFSLEILRLVAANGRGCVPTRPESAQKLSCASFRERLLGMPDASVSMRLPALVRPQFDGKVGLAALDPVSNFPMRVTLPVLLPALLMGCAAGAAPDWPQFRGPRGDGTTTARNVPMTWSKTNHLGWKVAVPGRGRSSPVVLGDRVWLTLAVEQGVVRQQIGSDDMQTAEHVSLEAICLDACMGRVLWRAPLFDVDQPEPVHWFNSWATPTPVVEAGRLYCDFGTYGTACLDSKTGRVCWKTRLPLDHQVGPGSSPLVYHKLLVLARDGRDAQYVTALDKTTGRTVWRTERPPIDTSSPNLKKSFVTPLLVKTPQGPQLLSPAAHWVVSLDPASGGEIWRARHGTGFSIGSCPVFGHGMVYFSTGCSQPQLCAFRADGSGEVTITHAAWRITRQVPVMSSPVMSGNELYWASDDGMATCVDTATGTTHWQERLGQQHLASALLAEGRIYFFGHEGKCTVIKAGKQFERLAENQIEGTIVATPAIVDRAIFLRTDTDLYRIGTRRSFWQVF
jgi:outer membrane protein assembly factor BamB